MTEAGRNTLFDGDRALGVAGVEDELAVTVGVLLVASLESDGEEREHAVTSIGRTADDLGGRVSLLAAILRPAERHSDAVILVGVEGLDGERPELGGVVDPGNQRHLKVGAALSRGVFQKGSRILDLRDSFDWE